jgi:hypothetical protein
MNFPYEVSLSYFEEFFNMTLYPATWADGFAFSPKGVLLWISVAPKIHRPRPGLNLRTLGPMAGTLTTRPLLWQTFSWFFSVPLDRGYCLFKLANSPRAVYKLSLNYFSYTVVATVEICNCNFYYTNKIWVMRSFVVLFLLVDTETDLCTLYVATYTLHWVYRPGSRLRTHYQSWVLRSKWSVIITRLSALKCCGTTQSDFMRQHYELFQHTNTFQQMELTPMRNTQWEGNSCLGYQEIQRLLWNQKLYITIFITTRHRTIYSIFNPFHALATYLFESHFNIILSTALRKHNNEY